MKQLGLLAVVRRVGALAGTTLLGGLVARGRPSSGGPVRRLRDRPHHRERPGAQVRPGYGLYFTIAATGSPIPVVTESGPLPPGLGFQAFATTAPR